MTAAKRLWIGVIILVILSPLGLILPSKFCAGSAWGEWSMEELDQMIGYVPEGMSRLPDSYGSPMPDYAFQGQEDSGIHSLSLSYVVSALMGVAIVTGSTVFIGRILAKREPTDAS